MATSSRGKTLQNIYSVVQGCMQVTAAGKNLVLVQECNQRPQVWASSDSVRVSFEQPIRLRVLAVKLARLAGFILRLETSCLSTGVFAVRPLGTPAARNAQLQAMLLSCGSCGCVWLCCTLTDQHLGTPEAYPRLPVAAARSASGIAGWTSCQFSFVATTYTRTACFLFRIHQLK